LLLTESTKMPTRPSWKHPVNLLFNPLLPTLQW
jgi:hypothetical protein